MLFHLFLLVLIIYTLFFFYTDVMNKINTNKPFAEGMTNSGTFNQVEQRYCNSYDEYKRNKVEVSAASPQSSLKTNCEAKTNELGYDAFATGEDSDANGPYNCTSYKNCVLSAPGTSANYTANGQYQFYKKVDTPPATATATATATAADAGKIKLDINGRWNSDISKEFDNKPGTYTVDESPEYDTTSDCEARDTCVVEVNDKSQARIRMLDRCKSVQGNHPFSDYIGAGGTIEKDGCSITKFTSIPGAPASSSSAGMNITSSTKESSSIDPKTGAKVTEKCVTVSELSSAANWVDHLFGTLSNTKCANKEMVMAAKTASKTDFISGVIKGYENDKDASNKFYMQAINKAKPMLDAAFSGSSSNSHSSVAHASPAHNNVTASMTDDATNGLEQNSSVPEVTTENQQIVQTPAYQQAVNQINGKNSNYQMANGNLITAPTGNCPNGCKAPQYDNERCSNQMLGGKAYRNCPWIGDGSINDSMCKDCGSVLLPKNQYGYARTRAGLFNNNTLNNLLVSKKFNKEPNNPNINYTKIGIDFMNELSMARNFTLPFISSEKYTSVGKIVNKYQLNENSGSTDKKELTDVINSVLNSSKLPSTLKTNTDQYNLQKTLNEANTKDDTGRTEKLIQGLMGSNEFYKTTSSGLAEMKNDNRLGGSKTLFSGYTTKYRPRDPRKRPNPYDSIWEVFK